MSEVPAVCARGVAFTYPGVADSIPAAAVLTDLSLEVAPGECLGLMGANGVGKTTLCRLVAALAPRLTGGELRGRLTILGLDATRIEPGSLAGLVGIAFQEVEHQLFNSTVEAELAWGLEALGLPPAEIARRIGWALEVVGLEVALSRPPASLSGGEQRRLALAVALSTQPELLVLDEPLSGLDPAGVREVLAALGALRRETAAAILVTESNPEGVLALADRMAVLAGGRVALEGTPREVFGRVEELAEVGAAIPQLAQLAEALNSGLGTRFSFLTLDEAEQALAPVLSGEDMPAAAPSTLPAPEMPSALAPVACGTRGTEAFCFERVVFNYPEGPAVLHEVELAVPAGQFVALVGANGSGKTTLAKQVIGLLRPGGGRVRVQGRDAAQLSVGQLAQQVGYLFQHPERQIFASTVWDEVAFGPQNLGLERAVIEERVAAALARFGLTALVAAPPAVMSYALRRLVTLASVAAMEPAILVLDEPTVGLDAPGRAATLDWVHELHAGGRTILLVTHDMAAAAQAERMVVLEAGRVVADDRPAGIFRRPELMEQAALEAPPVALLAARLGLPAEVLEVGAMVRILTDRVDLGG